MAIVLWTKVFYLSVRSTVALLKISTKGQGKEVSQHENATQPEVARTLVQVIKRKARI